MDETATQGVTPLEMDGSALEAVNAEEPTPAVDETESHAPAARGVAQPTSAMGTLQDITDKALDFLAHASNETLGACLVGVGAATYLVLGRVGLVIIGVAGGVVLHATWDGVRSGDRNEQTQRSERNRRREAGVEVMKRVLEWRLGKSIEDKTGDAIVHASQQVDFSGFEPETATALNTLTDAAIKDYVHYWYGPQVPRDESFPASCKRTLTSFILSISGHFQRKRPADAFLDFVTNASSIIIVFLNELAVATNASPHHSPAEAVQAYLEMKPDSSLKYVLDEKSQDTKLELIAEDILQAYLDPKAYNCEPVHAFLKQILAQLVLGSTVTLCSKPEWINEWIVYGLEESATTKEVMEIVDAGVEGRSAAKKDVSPGNLTTRQEVLSKKEHIRPVEQHRRQVSKAEEAMDEAMLEAKRLTQMMIEDDERQAREEREKQVQLSSSEDVSEVTTQGVPTPTSSQSDLGRHEDEAASWTSESHTSSAADALATTSPEQPTMTSTQGQFTSFDMLGLPSQPTELSDSSSEQAAPALTLHKANISIFDDSVPGDRASIKSKPTIDYLIQIEPASSAFRGWMIARKYPDFEMLHEVLRRISVITGVRAFTDTNAELPRWKGNTRASLRSELERYLIKAVSYQPLAESEGMKRFLEKDQGLQKSPDSKGGFGWPTPDDFGKFGGNMMNVLTKAPKQVAGSSKSVFGGVAGGGKAVLGGVAGGGKAVFGGVAGLVGGVAGGGSKGRSQADVGRTSHSSNTEGYQGRKSVGAEASFSGMRDARQSQDSLRTSSSTRPSLNRLASTDSTVSLDLKPRPSETPQRSSFEVDPGEASIATPSWQTPLHIYSPTEQLESEQTMNLPPPPSAITEDYGSPRKPAAGSRTSDERSRPMGTLDHSIAEATHETPPPKPSRPKPAHYRTEIKPKQSLSEEETSIAVELMFAVITELFSLSSAWNIRRTLLIAAKTYLLRPGNPQLIAIKDLIQNSLLDANLADAGMAGHIYKLRENALPTEEEMRIWTRDYPEKNAEEKEELRLKARRLLVQKGMPVALQSVMGAAASGEALGKVFDCLQVPAISRGLVFGLMLQALRVVTH